MARCFFYKRSLDVKMLSNAERTNHEFQFNASMEIKKEVENDLLDMEAESSSEAAAADVSSLDTDHDCKPRSTVTTNQYGARRDVPHPKLVIKFGDLRSESEQSIDLPNEGEQSKDRKSKHEILTICKLRGNRGRRSKSSASPEGRVTRSSSSNPRNSDGNREMNHSQQETASDKKDDQEIWNLGRITRSRKNLNSLCESCGMSFKTNKQLQLHKRYYTADGEFYCIICDRRFNRSVQLSRHIKAAHSVLRDEGYYKFKCELCMDRFRRKSSLFAHITHLHINHVLSQKKITNNHREVTSFPTSGCKKKRKNEARAPKSECVQKHIVPTNSSDQRTISNDDSKSMNCSVEAVHNWCIKNQSVINENFKTQLNDECLGNRLTVNVVDSDNNKANDNSTYDLINTSNSKYIETIFVEKSDQIGPSTEHQFQGNHVQKNIDEAALGSRPQIPMDNRKEEERNEMQCITQSGLQPTPGNIQPQLKGDLVDGLGSIVGDECLSQQFAHPAQVDDSTNCSSASITVDVADSNQEIRTSNIPRCTRSHTMKTITLNSSTLESSNIVSCPEQKVIRNQESFTQGENINTMEDDCEMEEVSSYSDVAGKKRQLFPHDQQSDQQINSVALHQTSVVLETTDMSRSAVIVAAEHNNFDVNLSQVDDFGESRETTFVNCNNVETSDCNYGSISLKMTASPLNISSVDLVSDKSPAGHDTPNDPKIKDVRVLLVKLENMPHLLKKNSLSELSLIKNSSLFKSESPHCNVYKEELKTNSALKRHSELEHGSRKIGHSKALRSTTRKDHVTPNSSPKILSSKHKVSEHRKLTQGTGRMMKKQCYLCEKVFRNIFAAVSHYLSVHSDVGVLQCCLCSIKFNNLRKLKKHLYKHHARYTSRKLIKLCINCGKEFNIPSLIRRCSECRHSSKVQQRNRRAKQYSNVQDLAKHQSASLINASPISISKEREQHSTSEFDHAETGEKLSTNFKCSICNCVFLESSLLKHHSSASHAIVKSCERRSCRNVVESRASSDSVSRRKKSSQHSNNRRNFVKLIVRKKRHFKSKVINTHDKLCQSTSGARRRLMFARVNSKNRYFIRRHHIRGNRRIVYNHKCNVCGLTCCCRRRLKIHQKFYSTNANHVCDICGLTFAWKHGLVMHMKTAHNQKSLLYGRVRCDICNQGFFSKKFVRIHLAHIHNVKYYQCKICRIRFNTCRSLNIHTRMYSKNSSSPCGTCSQSFQCKYMLEYHRARVHNCEKLEAYKYYCDVCNHAFLDELLLQAHIGHFHNIQHRNDAAIVNVGEAVEQLPENIQLPVNTNVEHIDSNVTTKNSSIQEFEEQPIPIHRDQTTGDAISKIRTHAPSEYKCDICKLSFEDPWAMLNHEWEFSNDGTHVCDVCNRKFMTSCLLNNHKMKHYQMNIIREYKCYVCQEDFSRVDHLKMHELHLHGPSLAGEESFRTTHICSQNLSDCRVNPDRDTILKKCSVHDTYDTIGLITSNEVSDDRKILFFRKIADDRTSVGLPQRNLNEDAYRCHFCKTNFSSALLLDDHVKKHAYYEYYTHSARYLCLICKNKFRTKDILRAHVTHSHTSDGKDPRFSEPECSEDSFSDKPKISPTLTDIGQISFDNGQNETATVAINSSSKERHSKAVVQNQSSICRKRGIQQSVDTSPIKKLRLSDPANDGDIVRSNHGHRTSLTYEAKYKVKTDSECSVLDDGKDGNGIELALVKSDDSGNTSRINGDSRPQKKNPFTVKVTDIKGVEEYICTICTMTFQSVAQSTAHFASIHMKNGEYLCIFCGKKFPGISDLKYHTLKHDGEVEPSACCDKGLPPMRNFDSYKLSHERPTEETQNMSHVRLSSSSEDGSLEESDEKPHFHADKSCKCEICDEAFPDFNTMLTHWDSCIDTNGFQCDLCGATFKSLNVFTSHKITSHGRTHNPNTAPNRSNHQPNGDQTIIAPVQRRIVYGNTARKEASVSDSVNINVTKKLGGDPSILENMKNGEECYQRSDASDITMSTPRFSSTQGTRTANERHVLLMVPRNKLIMNVRKKIDSEIIGNTSSSSPFAHNPVKSLTEVRQLNKHVTGIIRCDANVSPSSHHLSVARPNNITKLQLTRNESSLRFQQSAFTKQRLPQLALNSSESSHISNHEVTVRRSINISDTRIALSESGEKFHSNDVEKRRSNLWPASLNPANDSAHHLRIQNTAYRPDAMKNLTVASSSNIPSSFVPSSLNTGLSPTFSCGEPPTDTLANCTAPRLKSRPNQSATERLRTLLPKTSSTVGSSLQISDIQQIANDSNKNTNHTVISEASSTSQSGSRFILAGTSTASDTNRSHGKVKNAGYISADQTASNKQFILSKQVVPCSFCNLLFTDVSKLVKHTESHKTGNQCPACGLTFSNESAFREHLPEHKSSTCTRCNIILFFSDSITHPEGADKYCSVCHSLLPLPTRKFNRLAPSSARQPIKCGICMKIFTTISQMTTHFKIAHSTFGCSICKSRFSRRINLYKHMQTHGGDILRNMSMSNI